MFKTGFRVQNHFFNLCSSAVDSQRLLCSKRAGVKCLYLSFLVYKYIFLTLYYFFENILKLSIRQRCHKKKEER